MPFGIEVPSVSLGTLNAVPLWAWGGVVLLVLAAAYWANEANSAGGVARRARRDSEKAAAGVGLLGIGVVGALVGGASGASIFLGQAGDLLLSSPGFVAQVAVGAVGFLVVDGTLQLTATGYAAVVGGIILFGLMLQEAR